ncbi:hypothetical protein COCOBI_06-6790 [Coccomyxa sp. Obi]|nr:hypothetical protein COCOBI_06-6790 [Coccomyxa sp. Obi]
MDFPMVITVNVLQDLVDKALAENSSDLLHAHFGDACKTPNPGTVTISLQAKMTPAHNVPPAKRKGNASGESSVECISVLEEAPVKGPGAVMAIQLFHKYGKRDNDGHLLGKTS